MACKAPTRQAEPIRRDYHGRHRGRRIDPGGSDRKIHRRRTRGGGGAGSRGMTPGGLRYSSMRNKRAGEGIADNGQARRRQTSSRQ